VSEPASAAPPAAARRTREDIERGAQQAAAALLTTQDQARGWTAVGLVVAVFAPIGAALAVYNGAFFVAPPEGGNWGEWARVAGPAATVAATVVGAAVTGVVAMRNLAVQNEVARALEHARQQYGLALEDLKAYLGAQLEADKARYARDLEADRALYARQLEDIRAAAAGSMERFRQVFPHEREAYAELAIAARAHYWLLSSLLQEGLWDSVRAKQAEQRMFEIAPKTVFLPSEVGSIWHRLFNRGLLVAWDAVNTTDGDPDGLRRVWSTHVAVFDRLIREFEAAAQRMIRADAPPPRGREQHAEPPSVATPAPTTGSPAS
jgi:hypothetical protein